MGKKAKGTPYVVSEGQLGIEAFKGNEIRKVLHENEWYFSVVDVVEALTSSPRPSQYWSTLKKKLIEEGGGDQLFHNMEQLKIPSADGKSYSTDTANTETIFRIVQSIPSKKAEIFKRWLAKVGYERILEYQNPEIAVKRAILDYKRKGHDDEWIQRRVRSILARQELTGEWARRGLREGQEYATLTNLIQEKTFGLGIKGHRKFKSLDDKHNLRDHMTSTELIFTMLGETSTRDIAVATDAQGFMANRTAAENGGTVAGDARLALEQQTGAPVVSRNNFLPPKGDQKQLPKSDHE